MNSRRNFLIILFAILIFQCLSRYGVSPVADFTSDAWTFLEYASESTSLTDALSVGLYEPDRPIQASVIVATFRLFGDNPLPFAIMSMVGYGLLLILGMLLCHALTEDLFASLLFGLIFSLLPNLTESYHWAAMIIVVYMQIAYVASALFWVLFLKRRHIGWLTSSVLCFAVGLGSYEFGIGLPFVFGVLLLQRGKLNLGKSIGVFFVIIAIYLTWRLTKGFGTAPGFLFPSREPYISLWTLGWNSLHICSWWIGPNMGRSILNGLRSFSEMPFHYQTVLAVVDLTIAGSVGILLVRKQSALRRLQASTPFPRWQILLFALLWIALGHVLSLVSWTAPRLNLFPAIGMSLLLAVALSRFTARRWVPAFALVALICLPTNQGTAWSWQQAGVFHRKVYEYLLETESEWAQRQIIYFDNANLKRRLRELDSVPSDGYGHTWAYYRNASLLRGFVPSSMLVLIRGEKYKPDVVFDVEYGGAIEGNELVWHERYHPDKTHRAPLADVYVVDVLSAGGGLPATRP